MFISSQTTWLRSFSHSIKSFIVIFSWPGREFMSIIKMYDYCYYCFLIIIIIYLILPIADSKMANLFNLLFVLLCLSSVALASRENRVSETANALKKRYNSFPSCNQMICWPYIAKCNLFGACGCEFNDLKTCGSCCKKCEKCLRNRWNYCCECLKMCPPLNATGSQNAVMSTSGDLKDSIPSLFEALSYGSKLPFVFVNHRSVSQGNGATANGK